MNIYPQHILPCPQYRFIKQEDMLCLSGLVLIRHIESDKVCRIANSNILHTSCIKIQSDHLKDLSNNLLGVFKTEDTYIGILKEHRNTYCALWEEETEGLIPTDEECFKDENRGYYYIPIDDLLKCSLPEVQGQRCHFMIFHTPTKCNFWHISIRLLNDQGEEISALELNDKQKRKIWKSAKDFLITEIIKQNIDSYTTLPEHIYLKSS